MIKPHPQNILHMPHRMFYGWLMIASLIAALSLWPEGLVSDHYYLDKFAHFAAYGTLSAIPALFSTNRRTVLAIAASLIVLSAGLELAQYLLPHRSPSLYDLAANILGVASGTICASLLRLALLSWAPLHGLANRLFSDHPPTGSQQTQI